MSEKINSINLEELELLGRTITNVDEVQSIKINPIDGTFFACYPLQDNGTVILYPQNNTNSNYSETSIKTITDYGDLDFPLDTVWNVFNNRYWIADAGNNSIVSLSSINNSFIRSVDGFTLPHAMALNKNDRTIFVKSFVDASTQKITRVNGRGEILFEFEFPANISSTEISYDKDFLSTMPKPFTMDFDTNLNRLWFVSLSTLYMIDFDTNQITENNLQDGRLENLSCVSVDRSSGNAFVIIDDVANYYVQQIFRDNNILLGTAYLEEQPLP
jgi:hypothetical protein